MLEIESAPASMQACTTSESCSSPSESPGRIGATRTPQGMPASVSRASASTRRRGGGVPGSLMRQTGSSSVPIEKFTRTLVRSRGRREHVAIALDHRRLRENREGIPRRAERLDDAAREAVAALALLVGIGVRPHRDVLAVPARPRELGREPLDRVHLDDDAPLEVVGAVQSEVLVGRPREAVRAGVATAPVGVDRVTERHARGARHLADDRPRPDVQVLDLAQFAHGDRRPRRPGASVAARCRPATSGASVRRVPSRQHSEHTFVWEMRSISESACGAGTTPRPASCSRSAPGTTPRRGPRRDR